MSKHIHIENYELYALDYLDGNLAEEDRYAFEAFLLAHPAIAEEMEQMDASVTLTPDQEISFDRDALKIEVKEVEGVGATNYEDLMIAEVEGHLSNQQIQQLDRFIQVNPTFQRDRALYLNTKLQADESVVYPDHGLLKRPIPLWENTRQWAYRAAAVAVIAFGSVTVWNSLDEVQYAPRYRNLDYSVMDQVKVQHQGTVRSNTASKEANASLASAQNTSNVGSGSSVRRASVPSSLPVKEAEIRSSALSIDDRALMAYEPTIAEWPSLPEATMEPSSGGTMNLAQFFGKRWFGVDPKEAPTTKDVIRESLIQTIDQRESMSLQASSLSSEKRSIEFLAGNFEFKRVSYK